MKRVLITGITGYIGSNLAKALLPNCEVFGIVRNPINQTYLVEEIRNNVKLFIYDGTGDSIIQALKECQPDIIYHLAAHYTASHDIKMISTLLESNLALGCYLLEAMTYVNCNELVYATTVTVNSTETCYQPHTLYAATKKAFSDVVEFYTGKGFIKAVGVALSDTYGPDDMRPKVLNLLRRAIIEKKSMNLTSGLQIYDAVYIDDVVKGLIKAAESIETKNSSHQCFQLTSTEPHSLKDTVELMLQVNDLSYQPNWGGIPDPEPLLHSPIHIYPTVTDWYPDVLLEDGLRKFWKGTECM